ALPAHRQPAAVAQAAITAQVHQPFDIHGNDAPQIALDLVFAVDQLADAQHFLVGELVHPALIRDVQPGADFLRLGGADTVDVAEPDGHSLVGRDVHAGNTRHACCSCRP